MLTKEDLRRKNFEPEELIHSDTADKLEINNEPNQNQLIAGMRLADKIQEFRDFLKKKITVNSGFRCYELNNAVGGSPLSFHCQFLAIDFNVDGMEPHEVVSEMKASKISVDKVFVERGCVHLQIQLDESKNRNFFGSAVKINGEWKVTSEIKKV